jgi:cyanophycinase
MEDCMRSIARRAGLITLLMGTLVAFPGWTLADENPLGLPAPLNKDKPGSILLHGGGSITDDVFERFIEMAGGKDARIVLVPSAGFRLGDYESESEFLDSVAVRFNAWVQLAVKGRVRSFQFVFTDEPEDANDPAFVKPLETATGVWFSGGSQERLHYRFVGKPESRTRFQSALANVVERGGVVGGTSAGMAAIPEVITLWQERPNSQAPATAMPGHGLGLIKGAIVEQHFDGRGGRLERFTGLLRDTAKLDELSARKGAGKRMYGLAVEERTALIVKGDKLEVMGEGSAHVFLKSPTGRTITWHVLKPRDTATLTRDSVEIPTTVSVADSPAE